MALVGVELETPDALTSRPPPCACNTILRCTRASQSTIEITQCKLYVEHVFFKLEANMFFQS